MDWFALFVAGIFEIMWAIGLKYTEEFTRLVPSLLTVAAMAISFYLLTFALRTIPIGTAYAVWTGIGACGTALFGIVFLQESRDILRLFCLFLIIASIVTLKIAHR
ncbi:MAG TPA: quaternary ammonium compound efflux SMR transporter SugE [Chlamydiales bacterium]|nr:quaternary ammonium compound efflux SMR transporter SugE [Chlamydiales bacterium]